MEIGVESGNFEQLGRELERVGELFAIDDVSNLFRNPKFDASAEKLYWQAIGRGALSPLCRNFLYLLVDQARIEFLPAVWIPTGTCHSQAGRVRADVKVAQALNDEIGSRRAVLQTEQAAVVIEQTVDSTIVRRNRSCRWPSV